MRTFFFFIKDYDSTIKNFFGCGKIELVEKGMVRIVPLRNNEAFAVAELAISTTLKGADAIIVNAAREANCPLLTFDNEIKKKAKAHVEFYEA